MKDQLTRAVWYPNRWFSTGIPGIPFTPLLDKYVYNEMCFELFKCPEASNLHWLRNLCWDLADRVYEILDDAEKTANLFSDWAQWILDNKYQDDLLGQFQLSRIEVAEKILDTVFALEHEPGSLDTHSNLPQTNKDLMGTFCQWTMAFSILRNLADVRTEALFMSVIEKFGRRSAELKAECQQMLQRRLEARGVRDDESDSSSDDDEVKGLESEIRQKDAKFKELRVRGKRIKVEKMKSTLERKKARIQRHEQILAELTRQGKASASDEGN